MRNGLTSKRAAWHLALGLRQRELGEALVASKQALVEASDEDSRLQARMIAAFSDGPPSAEELEELKAMAESLKEKSKKALDLSLKAKRLMAELKELRSRAN